MKSKRKMLISLLTVSFVLLSVVATVAIAFALTQHTITTTLNISYTVEEIDGSVKASYTIGTATEHLTAVKNDQSQGNVLYFRAGDTENAGNLVFPEGELPLTAQNDNIVIQYTYANTGDKHYIASMDFDSELKSNNMTVEYSTDGRTYSNQRYAVVVPANTPERSYWIRIKIADKAKSASFKGDFNWLLIACDEQDDSYVSLTSLEFKGSDGAYSASVKEGTTAGSYTSIVFPEKVNGSDVTAIAASTMTNEEKATVKNVYIPNSVTTIGNNAFSDFTNLDTITIEPIETAGSASAQSESGLRFIRDSAFLRCSSLKAFTVPDTVTYIGMMSFANSGITSLKLGKNVGTIDNGALSGCALTEFEIPSSVTYFGTDVFASCSALKNITTHSLSTTVVNSIESVATTYGGLNLTIGKDLPVKMNEWGEEYYYSEIFYRTAGIVSAKIDNNHCLSPFMECPDLTTAIFGKNFTNLTYTDVFGNIPNLTTLRVEDGNPRYHSKNNCLIETETKTLNMGISTSVIPDDGSVTKIAMLAFASAGSLTSIVIPDCVTVIGEASFSNLPSLQTLVIGSGVKTIEYAAFIDCPLTSVTFRNTNGWTATEDYGMGDAHPLTSADLQDTTKAAEYLRDTYGYCQWDRQ